MISAGIFSLMLSTALLYASYREADQFRSLMYLSAAVVLAFISDSWFRRSKE